MDSYTFPLFGLPSKEPMVVPIGLVWFGWRLGEGSERGWIEWRLSFPCRSGSELFLFDCMVANVFDKDREREGDRGIVFVWISSSVSQTMVTREFVEAVRCFERQAAAQEKKTLDASSKCGI